MHKSLHGGDTGYFKSVYAEEASASESVSTGVLLRKDETWISIAYSEGGFGIRISVEKS